MKTFKLIAYARKKTDLAIRELKTIEVRFAEALTDELYLTFAKKEFEKRYNEYFIDNIVLFDVIA